MAFKSIRKLFKTNRAINTDKINGLRERVVILQQEHDNVFKDVEVFEKQEASLLQQGRDSQSVVIRKRLASQLNQVRKDLGRRNSMALMSNRQIDILNADIHNLTLIQQGTAASIGDIQTITDNAVKAEQIMENLNADAEIASSILGIIDDMSEAELAILEEFEGKEEQSEPEREDSDKTESDPEPETTEARLETTEARLEKENERILNVETQLGLASKA